jgi:DNA helicase-2/ATP-dependent DNA helicase PcrA
MLDLSSLNPPQREAVLHGEGPLVVFAGAGSGKTRVITYRIAHLVSERRVYPERILAVTFTNKAAAEMRSRILSLLPHAKSPWIGTFHSICSRILRRHAEPLGLSPNFVIYDDTDQKAMLTRVIRDLDIDERRHPPREMARFIEQQKQKLRKPHEVVVRGPMDDVGQRVYEQYEQRMQQCGALDFNDLLLRVVYALREIEPFREVLQKQWQHLLVDEFQDTNLVQLEFVRMLAEKHQNLCVVGDDDQSIYKWRGAERRNILDFRNSFPNAQVIKLEQNYRSSAHILSAATAVIARNEDREPKALFTENPPGEKIRVITCTDERDEARALREGVRSLRDHGYGLAQMAVFYRTHAQSRVLEEEMRAANIAYRVVGGQRFYERAEVKDVLAYLRVLVNPQDDVSLLRVINTPARGIGKTTIERVLDLAAQGGTSVWSALDSAALAGAVGKAAAVKIGLFVELIKDLAQKADQGVGPASLADLVLERTAYLEGLRAEDTAEADGRIENVQELVASMREFENEAEVATLPQYLELVTLQTNADDVDGGEKLTLMTIHAAKGLEFPVVWVAGLEERIFPMSREQMLSDEDLEEERRLAYVAFTRAEQRLFLSYACARRLHGDMMVGIPSRFLDEIPEQHIVPVSRVSGGGYGQSYQRGTNPLARVQGYARTPSYNPNEQRVEYDVPTARSQPPSRPRFASSTQLSWSSRGQRTQSSPPARSKGESYVDRSDVEGFDGLGAGSHVRHAKFGEGEVVSVEAGRPPRVTVRFPGWGVKQVLASYLELA